MQELTVIVTCHNEGNLLFPTLNSVSASIRYCISKGILADLVLILDKPDVTTSEIAQKWIQNNREFHNTYIHFCDFGDPSYSRNYGAEIASSTYLAYCDGDDLVSENYFYTAVSLLKKSPKEYIYHPEYLFSFGAYPYVWNIAPEFENHDYTSLLSENLWSSSSVANRATYIDIPYRSFNPDEGFGPEDWYWNIETTAKGYKHFSAKETLFFYRVKELTGINYKHSKSLLPPVDFYSLKRCFPANEELVEYEVSKRRIFLTKIYYRNKSVFSGIVNKFPRLSNKTYRLIRRLYSKITKTPEFELISTKKENKIHNFDNKTFIEQFKLATLIEPAITPTILQLPNLETHDKVDNTYGELLEFLIEELGDSVDCLVAVPWLGIGGADLVAANYATAFTELGKNTVILSTGPAGKTKKESIPAKVKFVQIPDSFMSLSDDLKSRLVAQALTLLKPKMVLSVNNFDFINAFRSYIKQISNWSKLYITFFSFDLTVDGHPTNPITDRSIAFLNSLSGIITDSKSMSNKLITMYGLSENILITHYQPAFGNQVTLEKAQNISKTSHNKTSVKLLWPHRLDAEKRPDVLPKILAYCRENELEVSIDVYGEPVLSSDHQATLLIHSFMKSGINYKGRYSGGLSSLPTNDYDALLITSESEGMPIVLLQSLFLGLPVISTNVGGIPEIIKDSSSGFLVADWDDVDGYFVAIKKLFDKKTIEQVITSGRNTAIEKHSWANFLVEVSNLSGISN